MNLRLWKRNIPNSINHAMQLVKDYGKAKKNLSVQRIADQLGVTQDCLYKWLGEGTMPANKLIAFEDVCGMSFVTQYLAHSQGYLLVKTPTGRKPEHTELSDLQIFANQVISQLMEFHKGDAGQVETMDKLTLLMTDLAHQKATVEKAHQPELELF